MDLISQNKGFLLCVMFLAFAGWADGRRSGGGGRFSRGGGSYSRSSRSSRGSTGRSSGTRYSSSSMRSPSRYGSAYVSYVPSVRYTRSYSSARIGGYWPYYSLYFAHARSSAYRRRHYSNDVGVCVNYESDGDPSAGNDSAVLGIFTCPLLAEEPRSYTQCCGEQYAEYCCKKESTGALVGRIVGVVLVGILVIVVLVFLYRYKCKKEMNRRVIGVPRDQQYQRRPPTVSTTTTQVSPQPGSKAPEGLPAGVYSTPSAPYPTAPGYDPYNPNFPPANNAYSNVSSAPTPYPVAPAYPAGGLNPAYPAHPPPSYDSVT